MEFVKKLIFTALVLLLLVSQALSQEIFDAVRNGDIDTVKKFVENDSRILQSKDQAGRNLLHIAANSGHKEIVELLLKNGIDIQSVTAANTTALHYAAIGGHLDVVKLLVEKGAEIEVKNAQTATPLYYAAMQGKVDVLKYLITKGADIDAFDREEGTPLQAAALSGHLEAVKVLADNNADIKKIDVIGRSALHFACRSGNKELVIYLLENGLDQGRRDKSGKTPLYYALDENKKAVIDYLSGTLKDVKQQAGDGNSYLHAASSNGLTEFVKMLISKGADVNVKNAFNITPVFNAVKAGHLETVRVLVENGADLNLSTGSGETPYSIAVSSGHSEVSDYLASNGAKKESGKYPELKKGFLGQKNPGSEPVLFASGIVSTDGFNERDIGISPDGKELYFTRWSTGRDWQVYYTFYENGKWSEPEIAPFSSDYNDTEAYFTPDGKRIYFLSNRPESGTGNPASWQIWYTIRDGKKWTAPKLLGSPFEDGFYTTFTNDWEMYYTFRGDLWKAKYDNGSFGTPEKLDDNVNEPGGQYNSFVAPDGSYLIFTTDGGSKDFGGGDLYICYRKKDGSWTKQINMGHKVNSYAREYCPSVSPDGKYFFFSSRKWGLEHIFWMDAKIIEDLKPEDLE